MFATIWASLFLSLSPFVSVAVEDQEAVQKLIVAGSAAIHKFLQQFIGLSSRKQTVWRFSLL